MSLITDVHLLVGKKITKEQVVRNLRKPENEVEQAIAQAKITVCPHCNTWVYGFEIVTSDDGETYCLECLSETNF